MSKVGSHIERIQEALIKHAEGQFPRNNAEIFLKMPQELVNTDVLTH